MANYERKNVAFNMDNRDDRNLYEWLQALPHGKFSAETKAYWEKKMKKDVGSSISFGYKVDSGEVVVDPNEFVVVKLIFELSALGVHPDDRATVLNEFKVPKDGSLFDYDGLKDSIFERARELMREREEMEKKEE